MAKLIEETGILQGINKIVAEAEKFVVLISPYVSKETIEEKLSLRTNENVFLQLFVSPVHRHNVHDDEKESFYAIKQRISRLPNCFLHDVYSEIYKGDIVPTEFCANFHAKCYFNEKEAIITSMNLSSYVDRAEIGVHIDKETDKQLYNDTLNWYFNTFCKRIGLEQNSIEDLLHPPLMGYCIGCGQHIPLNDKKPFCVECFIYWGYNYRVGSGRHKEKYCHYCGRETHDVCYDYPIERTCYKEYKRKLDNERYGKE